MGISKCLDMSFEVGCTHQQCATCSSKLYLTLCVLCVGRFEALEWYDHVTWSLNFVGRKYFLMGVGRLRCVLHQIL